jgi:hypothetical protein
MSSSYGDGMFYFLKPVGAGPGYPGSGSGYGELAFNGQVYTDGKDYAGYGQMAFDGQVYTDAKDYPVQAPLRLGYGAVDYGANDLLSGVPTRQIRYKEKDDAVSQAAVYLVYDYERMGVSPSSIMLLNGQLRQFEQKAKDWREKYGDYSTAATVRDYRAMLKVINYYKDGIRYLNRKIAERGARPQASAPQILRYAPPVVRQGFRPTPQTIPSDLRQALARLEAARRAARDARMRQQYEMEIARLQQLLMAQQAAAVQQTAPPLTQYAPAPSVSPAPMVQVPEGAVQAMPEPEEVREKQVVGLDTDASVAEEPSFAAKYGLFVGLAALAAGGYWYMNRDKSKV